jgi:hypothetical protein
MTLMVCWSIAHMTESVDALLAQRHLRQDQGAWSFLNC